MSAMEGFSQTGRPVKLIDPETLPDEEKVLQTGSNFTPFDSFEEFCNQVNVSAFLPKFKTSNQNLPKTLMPLFPLNHQIQCIEQTLSMYQQVRALANVTPTGLGKTFFAMIIAYVLDLKLYVIGTNAAESAWNSQADIFGIAGEHGKYVQVNDSVRIEDGIPVRKMKVSSIALGASGRQYFSFDQNFLTTIRYGSLASVVNPTTGEVTEDFKNLVDIGVFVVFDEAHQIKNSDAEQTKFALAMSDYINFTVSNTRSRLMYMSATLVDTEKSAANMTRLLGIVPPTHGKDDLTYRKSQMYSWIHHHLQINSKTPLETSTFIEVFSAYIKPIFIGRMGKVEYPRYLQSRGSYLNLGVDRRNLNNYLRTLDEINRIVNTEEAGKTIKLRATKLTAINRSLEAFELGLAPEIANFIVKTSQECPYVKVVVAFFHHKAINKFISGLTEAGYGENFILMRGKAQKDKTGKTTYATLNAEARKKLIAQFVNSSNNVTRDLKGILRRKFIIFVLQQTTAESISLHDTIGDGPTIFISCFNYQFQKLVQAAGRVIRSGMLSPAFVFWAVPDMFLIKGVDPEYETLTDVEKYHITSLNYKNVSKRLADKSATVRAITEIETDAKVTEDDEDEENEDDVGVSVHDAAVQFNEYKVSRFVELHTRDTNYSRSVVIVLTRDQMIQIFNDQNQNQQLIFTPQVWEEFFNHFYGIAVPYSSIGRFSASYSNDFHKSELYQYQSYFFVKGIADANDYGWAMWYSSKFNEREIQKFIESEESPEIEMSKTDAIL